MILDVLEKHVSLTESLHDWRFFTRFARLILEYRLLGFFYVKLRYFLGVLSGKVFAKSDGLPFAPVNSFYRLKSFRSRVEFGVLQAQIIVVEDCAGVDRVCPRVFSTGVILVHYFKFKS